MSREVRRTVLIDDFAENQNLARAEDIGRSQVEGAPVNAQPKIAFPLRREAADRGAIESQVVPTLYQEFLS